MYLNRDSPDAVNVVEEFDDYITINGVDIKKPLGELTVIRILMMMMMMTTITMNVIMLECDGVFMRIIQSSFTCLSHFLIYTLLKYG